MFFSDMIEYFLVILVGVDQNDWYEYCCNSGYQVQCYLVGCCILYGQVGIYYCVGWYYKWEYSDICCQNNVGQGQ